MANRTCSIKGCGRPHDARGWCGTHYRRWRVHGSTDDPRPPSFAERLWAKIDVGHPLGCWLWTGATNGVGYGRIKGDEGRYFYAHRAAYELLIGPIPDGLQLDHLCRNPPCCNPDHLEPVTAQENTIRSMSPSARSARAGYCQRGHPLADAYVRADGRRMCNACKRHRRAMARKR